MLMDGGEAGVAPSVGSKRDGYGNALVETMGCARSHGSTAGYHRKPKKSVELATLSGVRGFNHHRLLEAIGYILPTEAEANYGWQLTGQIRVDALTSMKRPPGKSGRFTHRITGSAASALGEGEGEAARADAVYFGMGTDMNDLAKARP